MAKDGSANTAVVVIKVTPREFQFLYQAVNAFTIESSDYQVVSNELKAAVQTYNADLLVYDANGIGAAIRDWLNKDSVHNGELMPGLGIINPPKDSAKDVKRYSPRETICYEIKAGGKLSTEINQLFFSRLKSGSVKMLIPAKDAIRRFGEKASFNKKSALERKRLMRPYQFCDKLEEELLNLELVEVKDNSGTTLKVKRRNLKIQKDFFSALSYGIYAIHHNFELKHYTKKKIGNAAEYIMYG